MKLFLITTVVLAGLLFPSLSHAQMAAGPMNRIVRPDTPVNHHLLTAIEAGDLPGVQAALQSGASADAEAGWEIPTLPERTSNTFRSFTDLAVEDSSWQHDKYLPIFRVLLHNIPASSFTHSETKVSLMCSAVMMNDLDSVRWLVARGVSIKIPPGGAGILYLALSSSGNVRVKMPSPLLSFLLDHGAEVNTVDLEGGTPLMWAAEYGQFGVVQALLAHGADPALRDKRGQTALDWAAQMGQDDTVALLRDRSPMNIYEAAQFGDVPRLKEHLDAGEAPNVTDAAGTTPLMKAAASGSLPTLRLLLERGADVRRKRKDGMTALHIAAMNGYAPLAALLLDRGADINAVGKNIHTVGYILDQPSTPLMCAVLMVHADIVALLLRHGASLKNGNGEAVLDTAVREAGEDFRLRPVAKPKSSMPIIRLLLAAGVSLRSKNSHALFLAACSGDAALVKYLLSKGADVNERDEFLPNNSAESGWNSGDTALMGAIEAWERADIASLDIKPSKGDLGNQAVVSAWQLVNLLLAHSADVNLPNAHGITPLMLCVYYGQDVLAEMLLTRGAKIDAADVSGKTALMRTVSERRPLLAAWLLAHHAGINHRDKQGRTALMLAIDNGANDAYRARHGQDERIPAGEKPRPVPQRYLPNPDGHPDAVRLLLQHGASVNAVALDGTTALSRARKENFAPVVALLVAAGARR